MIFTHFTLASIFLTFGLSLLLIKKSINKNEYEKKIEALNREIRLLNATINNIPLSCAYVDKELKLQLANKFMLEQIDKVPEEMLGKSLHKTFGNRVISLHKQYFHAALTGETVYKELIYPTKRGFRYFTRKFIPHYDLDENIQGFFVISREITELKEAEIKLQEREQNEMKRIKALVATERHRLQNYLQKLNETSMQLVSADIKLTEKEKSLGKVEKRLKQLVNEVNQQDKNKLKSLLREIKVHQNFKDTADQSVLAHFEGLHADFFKNLRKLNASLTRNDVKHCIYIKMQLTNKEIAQILHITIKAVEMARYRLKKKLGLSPKQSLHRFLLDLDDENN